MLNLDRHEEYHSLVENVDIPLEFYGRTSDKDGGYQYLKEVRENGVDERVTLLVQITHDNGTTYDTLFDGQLDLTSLKEIESEKKMQCAIVRDDLWARFINRKSIPIDVQAATSLDGVSLSVVTPKTLQLPSQEIRQTYTGRVATEIAYDVTGNGYCIIDFDLVVLSEIETKFDYPRVFTGTDLPAELFAVKFGGGYQITFLITITSDGGNNRVLNTEALVQINNDAPATATKTQQGVNGVNGTTKFEYSGTHTLIKGDFIRIYFQNTGGAGNDFIMLATEGVDQTDLTIVGDTVFDDSSCEALTLHDSALSITNRIIGRENTFYSEYFGGTSATARAYAADGCGLNHLETKGIHVRGYTFATKPFSKSFDEWWTGANPIFNLGLGYEIVGTTQVIRVEEKEHFYDSSSDSIILEDVNDIEISYDADLLHTSIEIGYERWDVQSDSGTQDPQTTHTYSTRFRVVGSRDTKDKKIKSGFYAASLGIEHTRRRSIDGAKDWTLDEEFIIIQADAATPSPILYDATLVTGLLNADTSYNVRLTPASNLNRWRSFLACGLSDYLSSFFKFVRGEGNTDMVFYDPSAAGCELDGGNRADEGGDVLIGPDSLFTNILYSFTHPLTWDQWKGIRDNRKKSILIRYYANDGNRYAAKVFIKSLKYHIHESKAEFHSRLKTLTQI